MSEQRYHLIDTSSAGYRTILLVCGLILTGALFAALTMEHEGHYITGMSNQIVWGLPHVLAIFLIVSASGALNVASISSVFSVSVYQPLARLSVVIAIALLIGGLSIILLDLGRPDRLLVAMTYYNFKSIFAWNIILYTGFVAIAAVYLWTLLDWQVEAYSKLLGKLAFSWRLILTAGTGSIFGVLVAREAFNIYIMAPLFIVYSLAYGLSCYLFILNLLLPENILKPMLKRLHRLLAIFLLVVLAMSLLFHLANLWWLEAQDVTLFLLVGDGIYPWLIWGGYLLLGTLLPLALIQFASPTRRNSQIITALVIGGGLALFYALVIGAQAYPMPLLEGYTSTSSFYDGVISHYQPSRWEWMLGLGGFALAILIPSLALRLFRLVPESP